MHLKRFFHSNVATMAFYFNFYYYYFFLSEASDNRRWIVYPAELFNSQMSVIMNFSEVLFLVILCTPFREYTITKI